MFNKLFSSKKKESKKKLKVLSDLAAKEKVINTLVNRGLLSYNPLTHRLFIATVLAQVYLDSPQRWKAFLDNIHNWALYQRQQEAWRQFFQKKEVEAVREAKKKYAVLSTADVQRIRQEARMKVDISAMKAPGIESFEFFIANLEAEGDAENILVIGKYENGLIEMAEYEEVKRFAERSEN